MRLMFCAALLAVAATPLLAQQAEPSFSPERVRADVEFLADDLLEGRDAGTRGYDIAALYVASRFEALGLTPGGTKRWFQPVRFVSALLDSKAPAAITIGGQVFPEMGDVLVGFSPRTTGKPVEGRAVFVGYGIDAPDLGYDDYSGLDVRGKIVVSLQGFPKGMPAEVAAHLATQKAGMAQRRGAIGMLTMATPTALARNPWSRIKTLNKAPLLTWIGPDGQPYADSSIERGGYLNVPASEALFAGAPVSLKRVFAQAGQPRGMPRGFPLKPLVKFERKIVTSGFDSSNVIAVLPGSDPVLRHEVVLMTAHLDHDGIDPDLPGRDKIFNGAMDNAAGIATMLEVARAFTTAGQLPKRTVVFAAVTAEEDGLLGSQYLAKNLPMPKGDRLVGVVNLDMPVLTYDFTDVIAYGGEHSTLGPIAARAAESAGVKVSPDPMPEQGIFTRSDHYSFVVEGVPSIMLATGFAGDGQTKFTNFLAKTYHRPGDDLSQAFNWAAGAKFARVNYLITRAVANAAEAPRWYAGDFFGETFAKRAAKAPAVVGKPKAR